MRTDSRPVLLGENVPLGKYEKVVLLIRRVRQLLTGAKPLVHTKAKAPVDIAMQELMEGKIGVYWKEPEEIPAEELLPKESELQLPDLEEDTVSQDASGLFNDVEEDTDETVKEEIEDAEEAPDNSEEDEIE